jgi:hypothetical protein
MNKQEIHNDDLLGRYINPEQIEKAPEGFTSKVMTHIQYRNVPAEATRRVWKIGRVPVISGAITILLIASVFLIPGNKSDYIALPALELLKNLKITLPVIDMTSLFRLDVPLSLQYGLIGILILSLLDRALYRVFHREK